MNGDLRVAYRTSREGPCDLVVVTGWFTNCEVFPELPSIQGWVEAMTSLGRLIFFDQPGTGASDPVTPSAPPTLEQWADSITAVLDDLVSREAVLVVFGGSLSPAALFAATYPSRTTALVVLEGYADPMTERSDGLDSRRNRSRHGRRMGNRKVPARNQSRHAVERGDPGNLGTPGAPRGESGHCLPHAACGRRIERPGSLPGNSRTHPGRAARRGPLHPSRMGQVRC